jgi:hypothetical protein
MANLSLEEFGYNNVWKIYDYLKFKLAIPKDGISYSIVSLSLFLWLVIHSNVISLKSFCLPIFFASVNRSKCSIINISKCIKKIFT